MNHHDDRLHPSLPAQYEAARALEEFLGAPEDETNPYSFVEAVRLDHDSAYPAALTDALDDWGLAGYYVPESVGGELTSYEEVLALVRVMARRDLTAAVAHGKTHLGAISVWVAGNEAQQRRLAKLILAGAQVSLGLSERNHGADALATEVSVLPAASGSGALEITGEKWLINNATRSAALTLFARSAPGGGVRGMSLYLVEKAKLSADSFEHLPKVRTHGIRGADISGIRFQAAVLDPEAVVGRPGTGLGTVVTALHVTRTMCAGFSLGGADTALRATLDFARRREVYARTVLDLPHARRVLARAFVDILAADAATIAATRAIHAAPAQMSVWAAVTKTFVPATMEQAVRDLAVVLGARFYLREGHWGGIFEKVLRDIAVVPMFDGSSVVNLHALVQQLRALVGDGLRPTDGDRVARVAQIFDLSVALPPLNFGRLTLSSNGDDDAVRAWPATLDELRQEGGHLIRAGEALDDEWKRFAASVATLPVVPSYEDPPEAFDLAWRYCQLRTAMCAAHFWLANRTALGGFFADGVWLSAVIARVLDDDALAPDGWIDHMVDELIQRADQHQMFSAVALPLAASATSADSAST